MASSPAHRFGQIIGEVLEAAITPLLTEFAANQGLYLDKHGDRTCRPGRKCTWQDHNGNPHDLDFVLESGGTDRRRGIPAAFIEVAWRRYTRHSKNKAQEIQGAIMPLAETYRNARPFIGTILAGVFTSGALTQLRSLGFTILYFPFDSIIRAFERLGINANYDEDTEDSEFRRKVDQFNSLTERRRARLAAALLSENRSGVSTFIAALTTALSRQIERIIVLPLHGTAATLTTIAEALRFISDYNETAGSTALERYEIEIRYNNGDSVKGQYRNKPSAVEFLNSFLPPN